MDLADREKRSQINSIQSSLPSFDEGRAALANEVSLLDAASPKREDDPFNRGSFPKTNRLKSTNNSSGF